MFPQNISNRNGSFPKLIKASDIAKLLNVSRSYAYELLDSGQIPCYYFGRSKRADEADVRQFLETRYRNQGSCDDGPEATVPVAA